MRRFLLFSVRLENETYNSGQMHGQHYDLQYSLDLFGEQIDGQVEHPPFKTVYRLPIQNGEV